MPLVSPVTFGHETANFPEGPAVSAMDVKPITLLTPFGPVLCGCPREVSPPPRQLATPLLQLQLQKSQFLQLGPSRGQYYGGSLPNVNQIGSGTMDLPFQVSPLAVPPPLRGAPVASHLELVPLWTLPWPQSTCGGL